MDENNDRLNEFAGTKNVDYYMPEWGIAFGFRWLAPKLERISVVCDADTRPAAEVQYQGRQSGLVFSDTPTEALCEAVLAVA